MPPSILYIMASEKKKITFDKGIIDPKGTSVGLSASEVYRSCYKMLKM